MAAEQYKQYLDAFDEKFGSGDLSGDFPSSAIKQFLIDVLEAENKRIKEEVMRFGREIMSLSLEASKADGLHNHFHAKIKYTDCLEKEDILYNALNPSNI